MNKKIKAIDYKKERDKALESMVIFRKMGDERMAEACFNLAAHLNRIRIDIDPMVVPKETGIL